MDDRNENEELSDLWISPTKESQTIKEKSLLAAQDLLGEDRGVGGVLEKMELAADRVATYLVARGEPVSATSILSRVRALVTEAVARAIFHLSHSTPMEIGGGSSFGAAIGDDLLTVEAEVILGNNGARGQEFIICFDISMKLTRNTGEFSLSTAEEIYLPAIEA